MLLPVHFLFYLEKIGPATPANFPLSNPMMHKRSKHFVVNTHFIHSKIDNITLELVYMPTNQLAVVLLTKAPSQVKVEQHHQMLMGHMDIAQPDFTEICKRVLRNSFKIQESQFLVYFTISS